jgi:thiamine-phosphate pyrophosphorylase
MDQKLLAWGLRRRPGAWPRLWLFTDDQRVRDPRGSVARLPFGRAGVVLRHDHQASRASLGVDLARICRARRLVLVVAGDVRLAAKLRAGVHLRGGRWPGPLRRPGVVVTSSAHSLPELRRAWAAGAQVVFLSPAFPTASHAGTPGLGPLRWAAMARAAKTPRAQTGAAMARGAGIGIAALGGVDGRTIKRLPSRLIQAVGAIGALSSD